jgi:hypothetical protein
MEAQDEKRSAMLDLRKKWPFAGSFEGARSTEDSS